MSNRIHTFIKIPEERVGVLIGKDGETRSTIERMLSVNLTINDGGGVLIEANNVDSLIKAENIVRAIGRGFSPQRAMRLAEEDIILEIINLRDFVGKSINALTRIRGRIIGRGGKAREMIEELTDTIISVYGHTVSIIGRLEDVELAKEAVMKLIKGAEHTTVYRFLNRKRLERRLMGM